MQRLLMVTALICTALVASGGAAAGTSIHMARSQVVVPHGKAVQLVVAVDDTGFGAFFGPSVREAVQMAIERHPKIRGFPIQVNAFNAPCDNGSAASLAAGAATANAVVGNAQNVAVLGHACSPEAPAWLPVYESAGVATINGSTTGASLPALGPTVFNGIAVPDPDFTAWYATVTALPGDLAWRARFQARFGSPPTDFADLYYDAANVLLAAIRETARIGRHGLVIDRAALAAELRDTRGFPGVTCSITLDPTTGYRVNDPAALARCAQGRTHHGKDNT
jgi:ABC-type branched-subunit amino acid transport system substrate-binding protein